MCPVVTERFVRDLANELARLANKQVVWLHPRFRPAERRVCSSNDRICKDTGWKPRYSLDQTLQDILNSIRNSTGQES